MTHILLLSVGLLMSGSILAKTESRKPAQSEERSSIEWSCKYRIAISEEDIYLKDHTSAVMRTPSYVFVPLNEEVHLFVKNHGNQKVCTKGTFESKGHAFVYAIRLDEE